MAVEITFGSGGDYPTLAAAVAARITGVDYDWIQVGDSVETNISYLVYNHYNARYRVINSSPHNGNPNSGYKITTALGQFAICSNSPAYISGGIIELIDLNITTTYTGSSTSLISTAGPAPNNTAYYTILRRCIIKTASVSNYMIGGDTKIVILDCKSNSGPGFASYASYIVNQIENSTVTLVTTTGTAYGTCRNVAAWGFNNVNYMYGYNNARIAGALSDANFKSGSSGNIGNLVATDEFFSTTITDDDYLFIKKTGSLANGGTTPVYVSADIASIPIPDYSGWYPIGCHCANLYRVIYLPEATGSGKEYIISDMISDGIMIALVENDNYIDGVLNDEIYLPSYWGMKFVDYKADNWIII